MHAGLIADLAIVLGVAAITGVVSRRLSQPSVLGYLFAGLIVGPYLPVPLFADVHRMEELAELGVTLVMFGVGLELRLKKLVAVLPRAGIAVLVECGALLSAGYGVGQLLGWSTVASLFLGACIAISSTMTVSKVLGPSEGELRELVLSMLILQDVVAIALIAAMTAVAAGGGLSAGELASTLGVLGLVLVAMVGGGLLVVPRAIRFVSRMASPEALLVLGVGLCFGFAQLAALLGYSVALGAFVAGMLVAESGEGERIEHLVAPIKDLFAAIFFVSIGMTVDPVVAFEHAPTALLVTGVVIVVQLVAVSVGGVLAGNGPRRSISAGLALGQIGEFAFIIAAVGVSADVVPAALSPVMVTVAVLTTFTTPLLLRRAPAIVGWIDRALPRRVRQTLTLYGYWLEALRERATPGGQRSVWRALVSILVDMLGVTAALALGIWFEPRAAALLAERGLRLTDGQVSALVFCASVLVAIPFGYALMRNITVLSRLFAEPRDGQADAASGRVVEASVRALIQVGVLVALGVPAVVFVGWLGSPYPGAGLAVVLGVALVLVWRRSGQVEDEIETGAGRILELLSRQSSDGPSEEAPGALIPGLDAALRVSLPEASPAVGKTLAELDLRAQTGATVVAIHHDQAQDSVVPNGRERLAAGDTLILMGTHEAKERARELLVEPAP